MQRYKEQALELAMQVQKHLQVPITLRLLSERLESTQAKQKAAFVLLVLLPLGFGLQAAVLIPLTAIVLLASFHKLDFAIARALALDRSHFVKLLRDAGRGDEALALRGLGDYERIICLRALARRKLAEGKDTLAAREALTEATLLASKSKYVPHEGYSVSEKDFEKCVDVADAYNDLGALLVDTKVELNQAERCFEQAIEIGRKTIGKTDPRVTIWLMNLGIFKQQQLGKLDEGLSLFEEVLAIRKSTVGEKDLLVAKWMIDMAFLLLSRPDCDAIGSTIEALVQQALQIRKEALPGDHELVAEALEHCALMAALTAKDGESQGLEKARDFGKQSAEMYERALGKDHPKAIKAKADWGV